MTACARRRRPCCAISRSSRSRKWARPRASRPSTRSRIRERSPRSPRPPRARSSATRALSRIDDTHMRSDRLPGTPCSKRCARSRLRAVARARRTDELLAVAMNSDFKDTAVAAVDAITDDRQELDQIIARGRNKSAVKRARAIVREAEEQAAREAAEAAAAVTAAIAATPAVVEPEVETATPPHGDPLASARRIGGGARRASGRGAPARRRTSGGTCASCRRRQTPQRKRRERGNRRADTAPDGTVAVAGGSGGDRESGLGPKALRPRARASGATSPWPRGRSGIAGALQRARRAHAARETEAREADARARREALDAPRRICSRASSRSPPARDLTLKAADRALRDVRTALRRDAAAADQAGLRRGDATAEGGAGGADAEGAGAARSRRLEALRQRRDPGAAVRQDGSAARPVEDLEAIAREVRELQEQWRAAADVPRAQADALWRRFKTAHDEVWAAAKRTSPRRRTERAENLAKKTGALRAGRGARGLDRLDSRPRRRSRRCRPSGRPSVRCRAVARRRSGNASAPPAIGSSPAGTRISPSARPRGTRTSRERKRCAYAPRRWRNRPTGIRRRARSASCRPSGRRIGPVKKTQVRSDLAALPRGVRPVLRPSRRSATTRRAPSGSRRAKRSAPSSRQLHRKATKRRRILLTTVARAPFALAAGDRGARRRSRISARTLDQRFAHAFAHGDHPLAGGRSADPTSIRSRTASAWKRSCGKIEALAAVAGGPGVGRGRRCRRPTGSRRCSRKRSRPTPSAARPTTTAACGRPRKKCARRRRLVAASASVPDDVAASAGRPVPARRAAISSDAQPSPRREKPFGRVRLTGLEALRRQLPLSGPPAARRGSSRPESCPAHERAGGRPSRRTCRPELLRGFLAQRVNLILPEAIRDRLRRPLRIAEDRALG